MTDVGWAYITFNMLAVSVETWLDDFVACSNEIQDVVMVSAQGQILTRPYCITQNSIQIIASKMLYLVDCISEHRQWNAIDWVIVHAQEGYLILVQCSLDAFLLIKATVAPLDYLQNHIQKHLEKFQTVLQLPNQNATIAQLNHSPERLMSNTEVSTSNIPATNPQEPSSPIQKANSSFSLHLDELKIAYCQNELTEMIGPIASIICDLTLKQNPNLQLPEFIKVLSQHIPDQLVALEFQKRLLSNTT